jgi:hypothetical protein
VIKHVSRSVVNKTNKIIIQDFNVHRLNYRYDMLFESTLDRVDVLKAIMASSQRCLAALICSDLPPSYITIGAHPGKVGFTQAISGEIPA